MPILTDVCVPVYHLRKKKKSGRGDRADPRSLSEAHPSVIEFSPSSIVVVFVSGEWMVRFFFLPDVELF